MRVRHVLAGRRILERRAIQVLQDRLQWIDHQTRRQLRIKERALWGHQFPSVTNPCNRFEPCRLHDQGKLIVRSGQD